MKPVILFVGQFISDNISDKYFEDVKKHISLASNTFYNALLDGFTENGFEVLANSYVPIDVYNRIVREPNGKNRIRYHRIPKTRYLKNIKEFFNTLCSIKEVKRYNKSSCIALFNVLRLSQSIGGLIGCKLFHVPSIGVVTDVPGHRIATDKSHSLIFRITDFLGKKMINKYDYYILLSEAMTDVLDIKQRKYSVVEGMYKPDNMELINQKKEDEFIIMYAGSLHYKYGIMNLVNAVQSLPDTDLRLNIYGNGEAEAEIEEISGIDNRIHYYGAVSHYDVICKEREVSLLVNPRPVNDEYVRYSFPSKNMEYMASGTPVLLTKIPSLPKEYYSFVYCIPDNTVNSIMNGIRKIKNDASPEERVTMGLRARHFIIDNKNPKVQVERIIADLELI